MPPRGDPTVTDGHTVPPRDFLVPPRDFLVWKNFPPFLQRDKTLQRTKPCPVFFPILQAQPQTGTATYHGARLGWELLQPMG